MSLRIADLRGIHRLAVDATVGITDLVETVHDTILGPPAVSGRRTTGRTRGVTGIVYHSVRGITRLVGASGDRLLEAIGRRIGEVPSSPEREAALAALNGIFGDYLADSGNPLAIPMSVRVRGTAVPLTRAALRAAFPSATPRLLVLVHGLCMNDLHWTRDGHDHGTALARDLGYTPVYLHYNSGQHISVNGRALAALMETLVREWPQPVGQLAMLGHSMGGLVMRSAFHYGALAGHDWLQRLQRVVFLGTPHLGAPLERAGAIVDFLAGVSRYSAPFARLGKARSAGIKDLGRACLRDEDWHAQTGAAKHRHLPSLPLPAGASCYAIAASRMQRAGQGGARVRGDGLVPIDSALGRTTDRRRHLGLPAGRRMIAYGTHHFDLLDRPDVYERIRSWLGAEPPARSRGAWTRGSTA